MTNKKSTKSALFLSSLSLLLCFAMLLGTTFAWFTDSATSAGNKIVAGKLDVELLMHDGNEYTNISKNKSPIFGTGSIAQDNNAETLWEPGKTQVAYLAIRNEGNLDLKYNVSLIVNNVSKDLYEVMEYAIIPDAQAGDVTGWTSGNSVSVGSQPVSGDVTLEKEAIHYFALAIHMDEEAGNEYQDGQVDFDITVNATQLNSEEDSFGSDYDAGLVPTTSENGTERELTDGSTVFYYNEESGFGGRVRLTSLPENLGSEYTVPAGVNDLGGALVGSTLDKLTIPAGVQYGYKSLEGATIDEVVLAEGTTTIPNRLFYKAKVENVVIPSSVTKIEESAFAQATPKTITVPASVTTIEKQAFAYMPELETVYLNSSAPLVMYQFRACPKLSTVVIAGDITVNTTGMVFSNYETGGKDNMTFYVTSDENAAALEPCLGAYNDTKTGKDRNQWTIIVGLPNN